MLTGTPEYFLSLSYLFHFRGEVGAFMSAIAERLVGAFAAGTPEIGAGLYVHHDGGFLRYIRLIHGFSFDG